MAWYIVNICYLTSHKISPGEFKGQQRIHTKLFSPFSFSLRSAQTLRKIALLRVVRYPLQGGAQQIEGGPTNPYATPAGFP